MVEDQKHLSWISAGKAEGKTQAYLGLLYLEGDPLAISRNWRNFSVSFVLFHSYFLHLFLNILSRNLETKGPRASNSVTAWAFLLLVVYMI